MSRILNRPLAEVCAMSLFEVQLWSAFLAPETPAEPDTAGLDRMCD